MTILKGIATGAALGTILGSIAVILYPKRQAILEAVLEQTEDLPEKARDYVDYLLNTRRENAYLNGYWVSGLAGLFLGASVALAVAPKSGRQFRTQLAKAYNDIFGKTQDIAHYFRNNAHPIRNVLRPKKKARRVIKSKH